MSKIEEALALYVGQEVRLPNEGPNGGMHLISSLLGPCAAGEVEETWAWGGVAPDAQELWRCCRGARLFADATYGQWGMVLLDPATSASRTAGEMALRPSDFRSDDVVIGEFLGDLDLVVIAPSESGSRRVLVALPLDRREEWYAVGPDLGTLLERFFRADGEKFWCARVGAGKEEA